MQAVRTAWGGKFYRLPPHNWGEHWLSDNHQTCSKKWTLRNVVDNGLTRWLPNQILCSNNWKEQTYFVMYCINKLKSKKLIALKCRTYRKIVISIQALKAMDAETRNPKIDKIVSLWLRVATVENNINCLEAKMKHWKWRWWMLIGIIYYS